MSNLDSFIEYDLQTIISACDKVLKIIEDLVDKEWAVQYLEYDNYCLTSWWGQLFYKIRGYEEYKKWIRSGSRTLWKCPDLSYCTWQANVKRIRTLCKLSLDNGGKCIKMSLSDLNEIQRGL